MLKLVCCWKIKNKEFLRNPFPPISSPSSCFISCNPVVHWDDWNLWILGGAVVSTRTRHLGQHGHELAAGVHGNGSFCCMCLGWEHSRGLLSDSPLKWSLAYPACQASSCLFLFLVSLRLYFCSRPRGTNMSNAPYVFLPPKDAASKSAGAQTPRPAEKNTWMSRSVSAMLVWLSLSEITW